MLTIRSGQNGPPLRMPWKNTVAVGRAYELLRADVMEHVARAQREIGFRGCRFHGLFHDDMAVAVRLPDGKIAYQWRHIDQVFDQLLAVGLRPFVELGPMPRALASGGQTFFFWQMNVTPPASWAEWGDLVGSFARHCMERYGLDEVRQWYFEVWNEPNLSAFWSGTQEEYFRLYQTAAEALKAVDSQLRVGGPASAESSMVPEFLDFCRANRVPVDFVSSHLYPQNEHALYPEPGTSPHAPGEFFCSRMKQVREEVPDDLEMHWTEWNTLSSKAGDAIDWLDNPTVDSLYGAALVAKTCIEMDDACDSLVWWVISDIFEEAAVPQSPFSGTYGLMTPHGVPKATFRAFQWLNRMRGPRLTVDGELTHGRGAVATQNGGICRVLLWNQVPLELPQEPWSTELAIEGLPPVASITCAVIRDGAGSAYEAWLAMGSPQNLTPFQQEALLAASIPEFRSWVSESSGPHRVSVTLPPGGVALIEFSPAPDPRITKSDMSEGASTWNVGMGARSP